MIVSEFIVWFIAIGINAYAPIFDAAMYETTIVTGLFKVILLTTYPY